MKSTKRKKVREGFDVFKSVFKSYLFVIVSPLVFTGVLMTLISKLRLFK